MVPIAMSVHIHTTCHAVSAPLVTYLIQHVTFVLSRGVIYISIRIRLSFSLYKSTYQIVVSYCDGCYNTIYIAKATDVRWLYNVM